MANAIESGELDESFNETPIFVQPVVSKKPKRDREVDKYERIRPQPATGSQMGFPEGYFTETYAAGPKIRYQKAYPSMFYNDIEKLQAKQSQVKTGRGVLVPVTSNTSLTVAKGGKKVDTANSDEIQRIIGGQFTIYANGVSFTETNLTLTAKHARHRHERVVVRNREICLKTTLKIVTALNNRKNMPKKLHRIRDLIRTENPGVKVRTSMITKAYRTMGWNKNRELFVATRKDVRSFFFHAY